MIAFDFDQVICELSILVCKKLSEITNKEINKEEFIIHDLDKLFNLNKKQTEDFLNYILDPELLQETEPVKGSIEFLNFYGQINLNRLCIITTRREIIPVHKYLTDRLNSQIKVEVISAQDKGPSAKEKGIKYFVDDRPRHLRQVANWGITPILFNQPWNRVRISHRSLLNNLIYRIDDLNELKIIVKELS